MTEKKENSIPKNKKKVSTVANSSSGKVKVVKNSAAQKLSKEELKPSKAKSESKSTITIKQIASGAGRLKNQIQTLKGLGLNKLNKVAVLEDTSSIRGMVRTVAHLIEVVKN
jgi:large subunit ribosomal protein L30